MTCRLAFRRFNRPAGDRLIDHLPHLTATLSVPLVTAAKGEHPTHLPLLLCSQTMDGSQIPLPRCPA